MFSPVVPANDIHDNPMKNPFLKIVHQYIPVDMPQVPSEPKTTAADKRIQIQLLVYMCLILIESGLKPPQDVDSDSNPD